MKISQISKTKLPERISTNHVQATRLIADGRPEDLVQGPFVSAATFMDIVNTPPEFKHLFGIQTPNPGVTRVHCPLLAFFGTNGDVGNEEDLELLKSSIKSQHTGPSRIKTVMMEGADHMYAGQEDRVARSLRVGPTRCYQRTQKKAKFRKRQRPTCFGGRKSLSDNFTSALPFDKS